MQENLKVFSYWDVKKQYAGSTVKTFQDLLAWPTTDERIDRGEEKKREKYSHKNTT